MIVSHSLGIWIIYELKDSGLVREEDMCVKKLHSGYSGSFEVFNSRYFEMNG